MQSLGGSSRPIHALPPGRVDRFVFFVLVVAS